MCFIILLEKIKTMLVYANDLTALVVFLYVAVTVILILLLRASFVISAMLFGRIRSIFLILKRRLIRDTAFFYFNDLLLLLGWLTTINMGSSYLRLLVVNERVLVLLFLSRNISRFFFFICVIIFDSNFLRTFHIIYSVCYSCL